MSTNKQIFSIEDSRQSPIKVSLPEKIEILSKDKELTLRDYQYRGVKAAFDNQVLTLNIATNGGKSLTSAAIIRYAMKKLPYGRNVLFLIGNSSVAEQMWNTLSESLEMNDRVGFWGSGKKDLQHITIGMPQTINNALKDPADGVKVPNRKKDKHLQYMSQKYAPMFVKYPVKKTVIRNFLKTHLPQYSFDKDCFEELKGMLSMSEEQVSKALNWYLDAWDNYVMKSNKKKWKKHQEAVQFMDSVELVIHDESHQSVADTFTNVLNHLPNARMRIGMTGTVPTKPEPAMKYEALWGTTKVEVSNDELIKRGISTKPYICQIPITEPEDLDKRALDAIPANTPKGQVDLRMFQEIYKQGIINNDYRNNLISNLVDKIYNSENRGVVLIIVKSLEHGEIIKENIENTNKDLNVQFLQGSDSLDTRSEVLDNVKDGRVDVLIATKIIDVGIDLPNLQYLIYCSAGKSNIELLQRIGRMLRRGKGKNYIVVYDLFDRNSEKLYKQSIARQKIYEEQNFEFMNKEG